MEITQALIDMRAELEREQSGKYQLENKLAQASASSTRSDHFVEKLQADLHQALSENRELDAKLKEASAANQGGQARLQESTTRLIETEVILSKVRAEFKELQTEKQQLETKMAEARTDRKDSEQRLRAAAERFARAEESIASLRAEANEAIAARAELEGRLNANTTGRAELEMNLDQLRSTCSELEGRLQKAIRERSAVEQQVLRLQSDWQTAVTHPSASAAIQTPEAAASQPQSGIFTVSPERLNLEIVRIEDRLAEVMKLIDDPVSALSTVMRKNREKTELESYLKGIRFAIGQDERNSTPETSDTP
jgi:chromosome segregation ATPase